MYSISVQDHNKLLFGEPLSLWSYDDSLVPHPESCQDSQTTDKNWEILNLKII